MNLQDQSDINRLCRTHWLRLYGLACRRGLCEHDAQDAVQDLFLRLLQSDQLINILYMPSPDHQAAFLTTKFHWQLMNRHRDQQRQCRGGGMALLSLHEEDSCMMEPSHDCTPEQQISVAWVNETIEKAFTHLRAEMKAENWSTVEPALRGEDQTSTTPQSGAFRVAVSRARARLRLILTHDVLGCLNPRDAAAELRAATRNLCAA
jgi:DNA-directed RNA polymerase specialized sigma24 family protein